MKERDANTRFSHACIKSRKRGNCIMDLKVGEDWADSLNDIRYKVTKYFTANF